MLSRSIVSNRNTLRKAREPLRALPPERREELRFQGLGPGDPYIVMWRALNLHRKRISEGIPSEAYWRYHMERIVDCCTSLMLFEKVRLAPVKIHPRQEFPVSTDSVSSLRQRMIEDMNARKLCASGCSSTRHSAECRLRVCAVTRQRF